MSEELNAHADPLENIRKHLVDIVHCIDLKNQFNQHPNSGLVLVSLVYLLGTGNVLYQIENRNEDFLPNKTYPGWCSLLEDDLKCLLDIVETGLLAHSLKVNTLEHVRVVHVKVEH